MINGTSKLTKILTKLCNTYINKEETPETEKGLVSSIHKKATRRTARTSNVSAYTGKTAQPIIEEK